MIGIFLAFISFSILILFTVAWGFLRKNIRYFDVFLAFFLFFALIYSVRLPWRWEYSVLGGIMLISAGLVPRIYQKKIFRQEKELEKQLQPLEKQLTAAQEKNNLLKEKIVPTEKEIEQITHLYEITKNITKAINWEQIVAVISESLEEHFRTHSWAFYIYDQENAKFNLISHGNLEEKKFGYLDTYLQQNNLFEKSKPYFLDQEDFLVLPLGREKVSAHTMAASKILFGVIFLEFPEERKPSFLLEGGEAFSSQIVLGLEKAWLYKEIEQMSRVDGLTGLLRRGYFLQRLDEEINKARYWHTSLGLIMLDIDHFKRYNDTYGHQAGDDILRRIAQLIKEGIYETDLTGRYGGEEFILLLLRADFQGVLRKMNDLRRRIESEVISLGIEKLRVTISIGIAHFPSDANNAAELIAAADQSLYWAKEHGRNQVVEYSKIRENI